MTHYVWGSGGTSKHDVFGVGNLGGVFNLWNPLVLADSWEREDPLTNNEKRSAALGQALCCTPCAFPHMLRTTLQDGLMPLREEKVILPKVNNLPRVIQLISRKSQELVLGLPAHLSDS